VPSGGIDQRRDQRFPVHLRIRFESAVEFVNEYAENLSAGGLFVRTEAPIKALDEVSVELDLPGLGAFTVRVRVAHVMPAEVAARFGRPAGAGVEIVQQPPGFAEAMKEYLRRLGRRRDHAVMCHDDEPTAFFARMGYVTVPVPSPGELPRAIAGAKQPIVAVVVPADGVKPFRHFLRGTGAEGLIRVAETQAELDALLTELDLGM
jgi:uncharacterized protein (TIGR02266 family)